MISKNFWLRSVASGPSKVSAERWWSRCVFLVWKHGCNYSNIHQHIHQLVYIYKYYKWGLIAGWWYTYPSAKCDFVSWDDDIPNWMEGHKIHVPNQPVVLITPNISKDINFRIGLLFFWVPPKQFLETLKTLSIWCHLLKWGQRVKLLIWSHQQEKWNRIINSYVNR